MVEHLQSGDQTMVPADSAWQAMSNFCEVASKTLRKIGAKICRKAWKTLYFQWIFFRFLTRVLSKS